MSKILENYNKSVFSQIKNVNNINTNIKATQSNHYISNSIKRKPLIMEIPASGMIKETAYSKASASNIDSLALTKTYLDSNGNKVVDNLDKTSLIKNFVRNYIIPNQTFLKVSAIYGSIRIIPIKPIMDLYNTLLVKYYKISNNGISRYISIYNKLVTYQYHSLDEIYNSSKINKVFIYKKGSVLTNIHHISTRFITKKLGSKIFIDKIHPINLFLTDDLYLKHSKLGNIKYLRTVPVVYQKSKNGEISTFEKGYLEGTIDDSILPKFWYKQKYSSLRLYDLHSNTIIDYSHAKPEYGIYHSNTIEFYKATYESIKYDESGLTPFKNDKNYRIKSTVFKTYMKNDETGFNLDYFENPTFTHDKLKIYDFPVSGEYIQYIFKSLIDYTQKYIPIGGKSVVGTLESTAYGLVGSLNTFYTGEMQSFSHLDGKKVQQTDFVSFFTDPAYINRKYNIPARYRGLASKVTALTQTMFQGLVILGVNAINELLTANLIYDKSDAKLRNNFVDKYIIDPSMEASSKDDSTDTAAAGKDVTYVTSSNASNNFKYLSTKLDLYNINSDPSSEYNSFIYNETNLKNSKIDYTNNSFATGTLNYNYVQDKSLTDIGIITNYSGKLRNRGDSVTNTVVHSTEDYKNDIIDFKFVDLTSARNDNNKDIRFRAIINKIDDNITPEWNSYNYIGRPDNFYIYKGFGRTLSIGFSVAIESKNDIEYAWYKINRLAGMCMPAAYDKNVAMRAPIMELCIGSLYNGIKIIINSFSTSFDGNSIWEISYGMQVPLYITIDLGCTVLYDDTPRASGNHFAQGHPWIKSPQSFGYSRDLLDYVKNTENEGKSSSVDADIPDDPTTEPAVEKNSSTEKTNDNAQDKKGTNVQDTKGTNVQDTKETNVQDTKETPKLDTTPKTTNNSTNFLENQKIASEQAQENIRLINMLGKMMYLETHGMNDYYIPPPKDVEHITPSH